MLAGQSALEFPFFKVNSGQDRSPKGWKNRNAEGVGLAIVAALEKPGPVPPNLAVTFKTRSAEIAGGFPVDFLSCCYLCGKKLHGRDIYMYRGEKGFCSMECRYQHIVTEEYMEKCGSDILRPAEISSSSISGENCGRLFFTGVTAA
ncbi:hypothetical protein HPP92_012845 [Vanilla planifolia]|uniref:FLZ-type domain-containing protein n=1 Tax=Vanilla planifolia TaxID=51239 RepID=A0A835QN41_VANPL|nr:hypothetical protein HPP92_013276 [Vanilla planifolia]KAG0478126.1 hypothetical protein HPP92_012845 [Vanilla planifolia]